MKPKYRDCCRHTRPLDRFLGTVTTNEEHENVYDVYVYQDNALSAPVPDMHVCLRYGNRGSAIRVPGPVDSFIERTERHAPDCPKAYIAALPLIKAWRKENPNGH